MQKVFLIFFIVLFSLLGKIHAQNKMIDSLLLVLPNAKEDTNKVIIYRMLTGLIRNSDPIRAIEFGKAGVELSKKLQFDKGTAGCLLNISVCYSSASKIDSAMTYINYAIEYSQKVGEPNRLALAYLNRADMHMQMQNLTQSLKDCDTSLIYAEKANNDDRRARVLQTIGSVYYMQNSYQESINYYDKAYDLYQKLGNNQMSAIVLNNKGNSFKHLSEYDQSITVFLKAIEIANALDDVNNLSMYHENLSDTYLENDQILQAKKHASLSMDYALKQENNQQLANAYECLGRIYLKEKNNGQAINLAEKAFEISKKENFTTIQLESSDLLSKAYTQAGNYGKAFEYLKINKELNDSIIKYQFDNDIAAMQTRFKLDEKENEIKLLNKDKEIQLQKLDRQRLILVGAMLLAALAIGGIVLLINRNRLQQQMKELQLRNQIAADLHDEVGSSLSSIHMLSQIAKKKQDNADFSQSEILNRMSINSKETMDKMGDIVWMIKQGDNDGTSLKNRIESFAQEISSSKGISLKMDLEILETIKLTMSQRKNLFLIFKEAINNAVKYSETEKININVSKQNKVLSLSIQDFGKGFDTNIIKNGNGIENLKTRAKELQGKIGIESVLGEGTIILLTIPI